MTPRLLQQQTAGRVLVSLAMLVLLLAALPAVAQATNVTIRIASTSGDLVRPTTVTLPSTPVKPLGAPAGQTCPGGTVAGAVDAVASGAWAGTWTDGSGWSIETIKSVTALPSTGRFWAVMVNSDYQNGSPCGMQLNEAANVVLFPLCTTASTQCFEKGPLEIQTPTTVGPGAPLVFYVRETTFLFDSFGVGTSTVGPSLSARIYGPTGASTTDPYFGRGQLLLVDRGPNTIYAEKNGFVPVDASVCVTDGHDGFCGTQNTGPSPFDPAAFCQTTGSDGLCGTTDSTAPLAQVIDPPQGTAYPRAGGPLNLTGTTVFDASGVKQINFRLMRSASITVTRYKKKRVVVKKRVKGKIRKRRVVKKVPVRVKVTACYGLNASKKVWTRLKKCDTALAPAFTTEGGDSWTYELPVALPSGSFTLEAQAEDGVGNIDTAPELGRNHITFRIA